jgi:hypothetical protein
MPSPEGLTDSASRFVRVGCDSIRNVEIPAHNSDELFEQWRERREREGERVNLMDLYNLVAHASGVAPQELPLAERQALAARALSVIWPGFEQVAPVRVGDQIEIMEYDPKWVDTFQNGATGWPRVWGQPRFVLTTLARRRFRVWQRSQ